MTGLLCATALAVAPVAASAKADAPSLGATLRAAKIAATATVLSVRDSEDGAVRIHRLRLGRQYKPTAEPDSDTAEYNVVSIVDEPGAAVAEAGDIGLAFLRPLRRNTYLDSVLEDGPWYAFVDGRNGWLQAASEPDLTANRLPLEILVANTLDPSDRTDRIARNRELVFAQLAAPHPLLADEGIRNLSSVVGLPSSLTEDETEIIARRLGDTSLPRTSRQKLIAQIADQQLVSLAGALAAIDDPALQEDCWRALRKLGQAVDEDVLREKLSDPAPRIRIAAARELIDRDLAGSIVAVEALLRDRDSEVRVETIEALGETKDPIVVPTLERAFTHEDAATRQACARAMRTIGGEPVADALHRLAFTGSKESQRFAVFVLLTLDVGPEDRRVRDIASRHQDEKVTDLIEHGLEAGHKH